MFKDFEGALIEGLTCFDLDRFVYLIINIFIRKYNFNCIIHRSCLWILYIYMYSIIFY